MLVLILGMLIAIFTIFIVLIAKDKVKSKTWPYWVSVGACWVSAILGIGSIVAICFIAPKVATESILDSKITMYQEENATIEQDIDKIVKEYLEHEHDTFADLKTEGSTITLVTLFPELKSDTLVQRQLEIYVANNAKIKSLREEKIDMTTLKWLLYFGK